MSILDSPTAELTILTEDPFFDEGQVAAAAYLARYSGRTLDAYRYDLRCFFQWASDAHLAVLEAKRPHIELYRTSMEQRNLAPSTIDRRLSTVCGFYRFAHIDGRVPANPAQYVRRPKVNPPRAEGSIAESSGRSSTPQSDSTRTMPLSPCCSD
jgi:integrase/recombinase XerD